MKVDPLELGRLCRRNPTECKTDKASYALSNKRSFFLDALRPVIVETFVLGFPVIGTGRYSCFVDEDCEIEHLRGEDARSDYTPKPIPRETSSRYRDYKPCDQSEFRFHFWKKSDFSEPN